MSINLDITQLTFPVSVLASYVDLDIKTKIVECQDQDELNRVLRHPDFHCSIVPNDPNLQIYEEYRNKQDDKIYWGLVERVNFEKYME